MGRSKPIMFDLFGDPVYASKSGRAQRKALSALIIKKKTAHGPALMKAVLSAIDRINGEFTIEELFSLSAVFPSTSQAFGGVVSALLKGEKIKHNGDRKNGNTSTPCYVSIQKNG